MSHDQEFAPSLFSKFLWRARYWTGGRVVYGDHDALMEEFQKQTWKSEGDHATIPLYRSRHNRLGTALTMTRDGHSEIHTNRISLSTKAEDLPFAIRQPIQKGIGFFLYADKYSALLRRLVVEPTDSNEVRRFREVYENLLMANSLFLREIFLLASLMYADQFDDEKLWEFSLWLEHAWARFGWRSNRCATRRRRTSSSTTRKPAGCHRERLPPGAGHRPSENVSHAPRHLRERKHRDRQRRAGSLQAGDPEILATAVTSLRGKHAWITAKLNGGAA